MSKDINKYKKFDTSKCWAKNSNEKKLPGEHWKEIPYFEETHEVSSYGRVRSLSRMIYPKNKSPYWREGRIMSGNVQKVANHHIKDFTYQVSITIECEGKAMGFSVRRLVYHCFVEPVEIPGGKNAADLIVPKDGNGMNTYYKNLIKLSRSQREQLIYDTGRIESSLKKLSRAKRSKMAISAATKRHKIVSQYDKKGNKIKTFPSITDAALKTGIRLSTIANAAKGRLHTAGSYVWRYGNGRKKIQMGDSLTRKMDDYISKVSRAVTQYNSKGKRMAVFKSIGEASRQTAISKALIKSCLHGRLYTAKSFIWKPGHGRSKIAIRFISNFVGLQPISVVQYTLKGKKIAQYESISDAIKQTGLSSYKIKQAVSGEGKKSGFIWKLLSSLS